MAGLFFLLPVLLTIAFMVGVAPFGTLALLILAVPRWRRSRGGWRFIKLYCAGLALFALGCLPLVAMVAAGAFASIAKDSYDYTLDAPRELDGITFPANSKIKLSPFPPHHLVRGHLGAPTTMFGLRLVNDFAMSNDFGMPKDIVGWGELAEPHDIDGLPCDVGNFSHNIAHVYCTPARDVRISGVLLKAGAPAQVKSSESDTAGPVIDATLAERTHVGRFDCAPGPFTFNDRGSTCLLAADQDIDGYILRGGTQAEFDRIDDVRSWFTGTLAQPLNVDGVVLPAGTKIQRLPPGRAETMRDHVFVGEETAWFIVADDATITVHGGQAQGGMMIQFHAGGLSVARKGGNDPGFFVLGGERTHWASFDTASGRWDLHP